MLKTTSNILPNACLTKKSSYVNKKYKSIMETFHLQKTLLYNTSTALKCLKLKTIYIIKGRSHCYATLHCDVYGHPRTWLIYTSGKTLYRDIEESVLPFIVYYCSCFRCYITVHDYVKCLRNAH